MKNKILISVFVISLILGIFANPVLATNAPNFPSCLNPQGTLKVKYDNGTHGIVGDSREYTGSDSVYVISDDVLIQCFCPASGYGIQTNWWKIPNMSVEEITNFQSQGWSLIPDGSKWGLSSEQYLAKNESYMCIGSSSSSSSSSSNSSSSSSSSSSNSSSNSGIGGANVGQVLALAFTGNIVSIYFFAIVGILLIATGMYLNKKSNKHS